MKIAQVAPLCESVPPQLYGGTERVVSYLTEALVALGHDVTLFASGDSVTAARLEPLLPRAIRLDPRSIDPVAHHVAEAETVYRAAGEFDIIHSHIDYLFYPYVRRCATPVVTTLHGRLDIWDLKPLYVEFPDVPVVSVSDSQRTPLPDLHWVGTVYHALPAGLHSPRPEPGKYLAFLGRISPEKRLDRAIDIAMAARVPLKIAAKVDRVDRPYFERHIRPRLSHPLIEYLGEIDERQKAFFLSEALALVFPIDWPEPFGLVMIEAMASGTPVIAFPNGSVPEVLEEGVTGFICRDIPSAVLAVYRAGSFDRWRCRQEFEKRFTAERMARDYVQIYEKLIDLNQGREAQSWTVSHG